MRPGMSLERNLTGSRLSSWALHWANARGHAMLCEHFQAGLEFGVELLDPVGQEGPGEGDPELVHGQVQELLVRPRGPGWLRRLVVSPGHALDP